MRPEYFCETEDCIFHVEVKRPDLDWCQVNDLFSGRQSNNGKYYCDTCVKKARGPIPKQGKAKAKP